MQSKLKVLQSSLQKYNFNKTKYQKYNDSKINKFVNGIHQKSSYGLN